MPKIFPGTFLLCSIGLFLAHVSTAHAERLVLVAGGGSGESQQPATACRLHEPFGTAFSPQGGMWIVEMVTSNRLLFVDGAGLLKVVSANGKGFAGDGEDVAKAQFNGPHNIVASHSGDLYVADAWNYRVRKIDGRSHAISSVAGTGKKGFSGDGGAATAAELGSVIQVALDTSESHLYVADIDNRRVRRLDLASGKVETVAGNGSKGVPADGTLAVEAPLVDPRAVAVAKDGGLYILERGGHALRYVDPKGRISTVVGTGKSGLSGDGGPGKNATMNGPKFIAMDTDDSVLIADAENHVVRRFVPKTGLIERIAGTGHKGTGGLDGSPLEAELNRPHGVQRGPDGLIYITDSYNDRVLKIVK